MCWVEGSDGGTAQASAVQYTLAEPQGTGHLGVTLKDSVSELGRVQSGGGTLLAEKATLCYKDRGERLAGKQVTAVEAASLSAKGAGVEHPGVGR